MKTSRNPYSIKDHLGNVRVTFADVKIPANGQLLDFYTETQSVSTYYPFGWEVKPLSWAVETFAFGYQGQIKDDELKGESVMLNYKYRAYDSRVARFFAVDPLYKKYPMLSPYQFSSLNPIGMIEIEGLEGIPAPVAKFGYNIEQKIKHSLEVIKDFSQDVGDVAVGTGKGLLNVLNSMKPSAKVIHVNKEGQEIDPNTGEIVPSTYPLHDDITAIKNLPNLYKNIKGIYENGTLEEKAQVSTELGVTALMLLKGITRFKVNTGPKKLNVYGEGETSGFLDIAVNPKFQNGRILSSSLKSGTASEIIVNNSPLYEAELAEISRLSKKGTTITYSAPSGSPFFKSLKNSLGSKAKVLQDNSKTIKIGDYSFEQRTITYKVK